jgi:hypothetical protein
LTADERQAFLERFGDQRQRIAFAGALDAKLRGDRVIPLRRDRRAPSRYLFAAAASIIVVISAILFWRSQSVAPTPAHVASRGIAIATPPLTHKASNPSLPVGRIAAIDIALVSTRSADKLPILILTADDIAVALNIRLNPADHFPSYAVAIRRHDGSDVWHGPVLLASPGKIAVSIPSSRFVSGDYEVAVAGVRQGRPEEDLGFRTITVDRRPESR